MTRARMNTFIKRWSIAFWLLLLQFSVLADVRPSNLRTMSFRVRDEPETLDWNRAHTSVEADLLMNLMEGLVSFGSGTSVVPALAQTWTVSADFKVYTFKLRNNVKWSDGVILKAKDFVYSWKRLLSPMTVASYAYLLFDVEGAEAFNRGLLQDFSQVGIKAVDDFTLEVRLTQPLPQWIYIPAFWATFPLRQDIVEKYGDAWTTPGRMVTIGPFVLVSHDLNSKIVMRANANYYGLHGNVDQLVAQIVKDDTAALGLYNRGEIDFLTDLATVDLKTLKNRSDLKSYSLLKTAYLAFVTDKYPISQVKVRRAIAMAIDRTKLTSMMYGEQKPANGFIPPGMLGYSKSVGIPYNPSLAMIELRNSGIDLLNGPISIDYVLPHWDKSIIVGKFIKDQLKKNLGIEINLQPLDNQTFRSKLDLRIFPIFDYSWTADYPDPDNFMSIFLSNSGNSRTPWKNDSYDQLVLSARITRNSHEREQMYLKLQKILLEDEAVIVPLYYEPTLALVRSRIKNISVNPMGYLYFKSVNVGN